MADKPQTAPTDIAATKPSISTKMLAIIALVLSLLFIGLVTAWLMLPGSVNVAETTEKVEASDAVAAAEDESDQQVSTTEDSTSPDQPTPISNESLPAAASLPTNAGQALPTAATAMTALSPSPEQQANETIKPNETVSSPALLAEMVDLQKQLAQARADNQTLIKQVQSLKSGTSNSTTAVRKDEARPMVSLSDIVRKETLPDFSQKAPPHAGNIELAPKWGDE